MRTFIFCTSYIQHRDSSHSSARRGRWIPHYCDEGAALLRADVQAREYSHSSARWERWVEYYSERKELFGAERVFLIDDGSPLQYVPAGIRVVDADGPLPGGLPDGPVMFRFNQNYGRRSTRIFPGWWRSFTFSSQIAKKYSFSRIIHCESDAYVISHRMADYVRRTTEGWVAFWCPRHGFPETGIQVICEDSFASLENFYKLGGEFWHQRAGLIGIPEQILPFRVEKRFVGDRYGEYAEGYPDDADYVCQSSGNMRFAHRLKTQL